MIPEIKVVVIKVDGAGIDRPVGQRDLVAAIQVAPVQDILQIGIVNVLPVHHRRRGILHQDLYLGSLRQKVYPADALAVRAVQVLAEDHVFPLRVLIQQSAGRVAPVFVYKKGIVSRLHIQIPIGVPKCFDRSVNNLFKPAIFPLCDPPDQPGAYAAGAILDLRVEPPVVLL